jgi:uncharacterized protein (DUF2235 family)
MKRIVLCCDGTWNELDYTVRPVTNVVKLAQSIAPEGEDADGNPVKQLVFYDEGVGTLEGESLDGGGFGDGLIQNVVDAYNYLVFHYEPGDEVYIFGFSRGAYTARSVAGMIRNCGIIRREKAPFAADAFRLYKNRKIKPDDDISKQFRLAYNDRRSWMFEDEAPDRARDYPQAQIKVDYLGVWDTVGQAGVPNVFNAIAGYAEDHGFHDLQLSSMVRRARHAVAIDEDRSVFRPTLWDQQKLAQCRSEAADDPARGNNPDCYMEKWFPGDHGSVGGGGDQTGLSDITLSWVVEGAARDGLKLNYDPDFTNVRYPEIPDRRQIGDESDHIIMEDTVRTAIAYAPNIAAPLRNVSQSWQRKHSSALGRFLGVFMKGSTDDRIEAYMEDFDGFSDEALAYAGFSGQDTDYQERLHARIETGRRKRRAAG